MCGCADESVYRALEQLTRLQHLELSGSRTVVSCKLLATSPAAARLRTLRMQHSALDVRDVFLFVLALLSSEPPQITECALLRLQLDDCVAARCMSSQACKASQHGPCCNMPRASHVAVHTCHAD